MVFDRLLNKSKVNIVTDISEEKISMIIKFFGASKTFYLRPEDLSTKGLERFHRK